MATTPPPGKGPILRLLSRPIMRTILVAHGVFAAIVMLWMAGFFEGVELSVYDNFVAIRSAHYTAPDPVVIVGANEHDLNTLGWPLPDDVLARVLDRLEASGAAIIGVDFYRDRPRGSGMEALNQVLTTHPNIICISRAAIRREKAIPGPPVLQGTDRLGFANVLADPDGVLRRALIFVDDGRQSYESLAFRVARGYLALDGLTPRNAADDPNALLLGKGRLLPFASGQGGYVRAHAGGFQVLMDYLGGAHPFPVISLARVLAGDVPAEQIRGKVVLLGVAADSVKDIFFSPLGHGASPAASQIFGIEFHGHVVAELVRTARQGLSPPRGVSLSTTLVLLWLASLLGGLSVTRVHSVAIVGAGCVGIIMVLAGAGYGLLTVGFWIPVVAPSLGWIGSAVLESVLLWQQERQSRSRLMEIFSQNVSPAIAKDLWEHRDEFASGGRPRPQKLTATVLFTDIKGFTSISEKLEPEELLGWLNDYMTRMAEIVVAHDGVINKYIGDSIMAIFGVPIARRTVAEIAHDAQQAVKCALAMREALAELNAKWVAEGVPTIGMRVGINTGPLVAGTLGSHHRLEYTVIGDTVNTASRLESFDKTLAEDAPCRILISEATYLLVEEVVMVRQVGHVRLKGKEEPLPIFLVSSKEDLFMSKPTKPASVGGAAIAPVMLLSLIVGMAAARADSTAAPLYQPPHLGAPSELDDSAGGGTRGGPAAGFRVEVLAPGDHAGLTRREQPTLYWYASAPITKSIEITVSNDADPAPLLDVTLTAPQPAGIHALSLAGTSAHLQPGTAYQWAVAVIMDPAARSADMVSAGYIKRDPAVAGADDTVSLAKAGLWYDALDAAVHKDTALRSELLHEIGLTDAAADLGPVR